MKKQKIVWIIIMTLLTGSINAQWIKQSGPYLSDSLNQVYWVDASNIFIIGKNNLIYKSENGGVSWTNKNSGIVQQGQNSTNVTSIKFFNSQTGFSGNSLLYKTIDGGNNWSVVSPDQFENYFYVTPDVVYAVKTIANKLTLFSSVNAGVNWTQKDTVSISTKKIVFVNQNTGYYIFKNNIYKSTNAGSNWTLNWNSSLVSTINDIEFQNENSGIATFGGALMKTTDGAQTWSALVTTPQTNYYLSLYRNDTIMTVYSSTQISINYSTNNGNSFTGRAFSRPFANNNGNATKISFLNINTGIVAGNISRIFKTTNIGVSFNNYSTTSILDQNLTSIQIFSPDELFVSGKTYFAKTTNGGTFWDTVHTEVQFKEIAFADYNSGYAISYNKVWKTTNHGASWNSLPFTGEDNPEFFNLKVNPAGRIAFKTYAYVPWWGGVYTIRERLYHSLNGGDNFTELLAAFGGGNTTGSERFSLQQHFILDASTSFCILNHSTSGNLGVSSNGKLFRTTNNGVNWDTVFSRDSTQLKNLYFLNNYIGYFSLLSNYNNSEITGLYKTINGGNSWFRISGFAPDKFLFTNESTAYSPGYCSSDGGYNWTYQFSPSSANAISFANNLTGYIVGDFGVIYKTTNGGGIVLNVNQTSGTVPKNYTLSQNYPNPFNPSTRINYELKITNYVSLKVFDLLGKQVPLLVNEKQNAGSYAVDFNSSEFSLPSGIYFYTLNAGEFTETRKMVLVK